MMQFHLKINLGNDAMQSGEDIADALVDVAQDVRYQKAGRILDLNGNTVGSWELSDDV